MIRVPYNIKPSIPPLVLPPSAHTLPGAVAAVVDFLDPSTGSTALLTGAGVSVESGIPDYRGPTGTYTVNRDYRPIFYTEFVHNHEIRQRYWARGFLGWQSIRQAKPNRVHKHVGDLISNGWLASVITQNVDSLHSHFVNDVTEIHGSLARAVCLTCGSSHDRGHLQELLCRLNPAWHNLLQLEIDRLATTSTTVTANPMKDLRLNPDGDLELPGNVRYNGFKYPACPTCVETGLAKVTSDGAWSTENQNAGVPHANRKRKDVGVLKPDVVFFGESVNEDVKNNAERKLRQADKVLIMGSSIATYSAFRLIKESKAAGKRIGVINVGPIRGEHELLTQGDLRVSFNAGDVLEGVVQSIRST
ncbi:DHS-like NAD/FAD-binding domain-containing protein [Lipomyces japonicus]|uniref:DHS-like NAD/FAD-binding domain-containing protein n=1 Tax=Lipomyces japonicus TaxID=56871 RepID=UPI0034CDC709